VGNTPGPLILMSDGTHVSDFAGDKKQWRVWMTIGYIWSKIRQRPSMSRVEMVTLLPIPIKNPNIPQNWVHEQLQTTREVLEEWLRQDSSLSHFNTIPTPRAVITTFPVELVTSGVADEVYQYRLQIAQRIVTCIIASGMSVFGASVHRTNLHIMTLLRTNNPGATTAYTECWVMLTPRQPMQNSHSATFTEY